MRPPDPATRPVATNRLSLVAIRRGVDRNVFNMHSYREISGASGFASRDVTKRLA